MINKIKNITAYFLLFLGIVIGIKTIPSAIYKILYKFNITNTISLDMTDCNTFTFSIIKTDFFYPLFLFAILCLCVGTLILFRKQKLTFQTKFFDICFLICFFVLVLYLLSLFIYIFLLMLEDNLFDKHIIYTIAFTIGLLTNLLFLILYILIWFDAIFDNKTKIFCLLSLCLLSTHICICMFSFIDLYGINGKEFNPEIFYTGFNYILESLGLSAYCMESQNPCAFLFKQMKHECDKARDAKSIPRIPYAGGSFTLRWITRIMNNSSIIYKQQKQKNCNDARQNYYDCMDFIRSEYKKKNK